MAAVCRPVPAAASCGSGAANAGVTGTTVRKPQRDRGRRARSRWPVSSPPAQVAAEEPEVEVRAQAASPESRPARLIRRPTAACPCARAPIAWRASRGASARSTRRARAIRLSNAGSSVAGSDGPTADAGSRTAGDGVATSAAGCDGLARTGVRLPVRPEVGRVLAQGSRSSTMDGSTTFSSTIGCSTTARAIDAAAR